MKDRSLVAFTLFFQMAVGASWIQGALYLWATRQVGNSEANAFISRTSGVVVPVVVLGLLTSFFHLGVPYRAWRAISNLKSSWLSREILFALMFTGTSVLFAAMHWLEWGSGGTRSVIGWLAAVLGLALIYSMANAYQLRTIPAWNTWVTVASFFGTTLLLGMLLVVTSLLIVVDVPTENLQLPLYWLGVSMIILLFMQIIITLMWIDQLAKGQETAMRAVERITRKHSKILVLRFGLAMAGILAIVTSLASWENGGIDIPVILVFVLVLGSEVLGRLLFYEARVRFGI